MVDYIVKYKYYINDLEFNTDTIITIEEDIIIDDKDVKFSKVERDIDFEREQLTTEILYEKLKDKISNDVELVDYEELIERDNLYKFEYKDIYDEDTARYDYEDTY
jgi:hypothetical protein